MNFKFDLEGLAFDIAFMIAVFIATVFVMTLAEKYGIIVFIFVILLIGILLYFDYYKN